MQVILALCCMGLKTWASCCPSLDTFPHVLDPDTGILRSTAQNDCVGSLLLGWVPCFPAQPPSLGTCLSLCSS